MKKFKSYTGFLRFDPSGLMFNQYAGGTHKVDLEKSCIINFKKFLFQTVIVLGVIEKGLLNIKSIRLVDFDGDSMEDYEENWDDWDYFVERAKYSRHIDIDPEAA